MVWVLYITGGITGALVGTYAEWRRPWWAQWWYGLWMVISVVACAVASAQRDWGLAAWMAFCAFINGRAWWRHRKNRKRKRAAALVGAKSRERIETLVRKTREAGQPRRVLRPAPDRS